MSRAISALVACLCALLVTTRAAAKPSPPPAAPTTPAPAAVAPAPELGSDARPLVVGTDVVDPFIMRGSDGSWGGVSIDLFKTACDKLNLKYAFRLESDDDRWKHPEAYGLDALVSMNVSSRKEKTVDLGQAFFHTGLAIATRTEPKNGAMAILSKIASISFLRGLAILLLVLFVMGTVVYFLERKAKPDEFGVHPARGIARGVFWAFESLVGKASSLSRTGAGRLVALLWTFTITLLVSGVTAKLSAELTVNQLATTVNGPNDLPKVRVGVETAEASGNWVTSAERYLKSHGIRYKSCGHSTGDCLAALARGDVDALVGEAPVLRYQAAKKFSDRVVVLPGTFDNHGYAFGFPMGSPLRKKFDIAVLEIVEGQEWKDILAKYDLD